MVLLWLLACAAAVDSDDPCEPGAPPTLEIGTGTFSFSPLGEEIELEDGPQGGYHLILSFRATFLDDTAPSVGHLVGAVDGLPLADAVHYLNFRCQPEDGAEEAWGSLLSYDADPQDLVNRETTISVEITDARGTVATATTVVTIVDRR